MSASIRVMTWNVHSSFQLNPKFDLDGVCSIIRRWSPDIVALQEVDSRRRTDDPFSRLAAAVGEYRAEARSIVTQDGDYGQVLLSRWAFSADPDVIDVSHRQREPRRAICAHVRSPIGDVQVVATHLGLSVGERFEQAQAIARLIRPTRCLVLGDFNDWLWVRSVRKVLAAQCPVGTQLRTFPAHWPVLRLDRIYATPDALLRHSWTDQEARDHSDHLPVIADLGFR